MDLAEVLGLHWSGPARAIAWKRRDWRVWPRHHPVRSAFLLIQLEKISRAWPGCGCSRANSGRPRRKRARLFLIPRRDGFTVYPFFDTVNITPKHYRRDRTHRPARIKKRILPNVAQVRRRSRSNLSVDRRRAPRQDSVKVSVLRRWVGSEKGAA